ncbi:LpxL/LpxP family Kdo(2)-lipid IV(A) lauroyl/palmitoleoyl acyltransferase [Vibrio cortegadensis]|uniref:Lipid A biosynthesis acyltransferase n=1 Tax=Vibrio cortegadensis TaxID=1328770 RepID=A0ABV4M3F3_9VIBR
MKSYSAPKFTIKLLSPKYWGVWLGFGLLALIVTVLPYRLLKRLGFYIGSLTQKFAQKRVSIAENNLSLAFPDMQKDQQKKILESNINNSGLAIIETGMAWFWPDWRVRNHVKLVNTEQMKQLESEKRGVLVVCVHALNLEMTARAFSLFAPGYGVYRPHNNPAYDFIQFWGRTRFGHQMVDRKDVKGMMKILRKGGRLWYLPDHDYGFKNSVFVPFFAVEQASTTMGTGVLVDATKCAVVTASSFRTDELYTLDIDEDISQLFPRRDTTGAAVVMNKAVEKVIMKGVDQWMWMHRRYKTMPDNKNNGSRYR